MSGRPTLTPQMVAALFFLACKSIISVKGYDEQTSMLHRMMVSSVGARRMESRTARQLRCHAGHGEGAPTVVSQTSAQESLQVETHTLRPPVFTSGADGTANESADTESLRHSKVCRPARCWIPRNSPHSC